MFFFFSSRRRHTRSDRDWSSDVCSSDLFAVDRHGRGRQYPGCHLGGSDQTGEDREIDQHGPGKRRSGEKEWRQSRREHEERLERKGGREETVQVDERKTAQ